ncbi:MAG: sulfatase-like hydrolase/transferase, partial [Candidatus Baldrarchaeia archaeon]
MALKKSNSEQLSIILITIDSLRVDHLRCYGYHRNTSPNIDSLASKGALFLQAVSNGGGTPEAFPSILASTLPPVRAEEYAIILKERSTIAEILKERGYNTGAFHSNPYLSKFFHYDKGFDTFDDSMSRLGLIRKWRV